jgi:hypothetical protein
MLQRFGAAAGLDETTRTNGRTFMVGCGERQGSIHRECPAAFNRHFTAAFLPKRRIGLR